jgi:hypothetical protein
MQVINHVFKDVKLFALPHGGNEGIRRDPDGALWQKLQAVDQQLMAAALPVTLLSESDSEVRYEGTPTTIASAMENTIARFHTSARARFFASPRARETAAREATAVASACYQKYHDAVTDNVTLACGARHEGAFFDALVPARAAAEECFVLGTAEWRAGGDPRTADMLNHTLRELMDRIRYREDMLRHEWFEKTRVSDWEKCSANYGPRCHPFHPKRRYADFSRYRCKIVIERMTRNMC